MATSNGGIIGPTQSPSFGDSTVNEYTSSGTFSSGTHTQADILVIGAGGSNTYPGGNGAGGMRQKDSHPISASTDYPITIGTASTGVGNGGASQFGASPQPAYFAASGGGYGGNRHANGEPGGSGGGAGDGATLGPSRSGGSGNSGGYSPPEGNPGGNGTPSPQYEPGGGGGGAGGTGGTGGPQGAGLATTITGSPVTHCQGGNGDGGSMTNPNDNGGYGHGASNYTQSDGPAADKSYPGYVVVKTGAFSNASGVWNMADVYEGRLAGTWGS